MDATFTASIQPLKFTSLVNLDPFIQLLSTYFWSHLVLQSAAHPFLPCAQTRVRRFSSIFLTTPFLFQPNSAHLHSSLRSGASLNNTLLVLNFQHVHFYLIYLTLLIHDVTIILSCIPIFTPLSNSLFLNKHFSHFDIHTLIYVAHILVLSTTFLSNPPFPTKYDVFETVLFL